MSYVSFDLERSGKKCGVIGCGALGAEIGRALAASGLFDAVVLLDEDTRLCKGQAADIAASLPLHTSVDVWAGEYADLQGCALIVLASGQLPLHETMESELPFINLPILRRAIAGLSPYVGNAVLLVATQPTDLMTFVALHYSGLPAARVIGLGTLPDALQLRRLLGRYLSANPAQIEAMVLGQAGDNATVIWSGVRIGGMDADLWRGAQGRSCEAMILHSLYTDVRCAAAQSADAKGYGIFAAAQAAALVACAVVRDQNSLLGLCTLSDGRFGVGNLCMSLPCIIGRGGVLAMPEPALAAAEQAELEKSAARLRSMICRANGLLCQT